MNNSELTFSVYLPAIIIGRLLGVYNANNWISFLVDFAVYIILYFIIDKFRYTGRPETAHLLGMDEILKCDCNECTHWEIVKDKKGDVYLHCKTCERADFVTLVISEWQPAKWVDVKE